jgi:hypothetical protein
MHNYFNRFKTAYNSENFFVPTDEKYSFTVLVSLSTQRVHFLNLKMQIRKKLLYSLEIVAGESILRQNVA